MIQTCNEHVIYFVRLAYFADMCVSKCFSLQRSCCYFLYGHSYAGPSLRL